MKRDSTWQLPQSAKLLRSAINIRSDLKHFLVKIGALNAPIGNEVEHYSLESTVQAARISSWSHQKLDVNIDEFGPGHCSGP